MPSKANRNMAGLVGSAAKYPLAKGLKCDVISEESEISELSDSLTSAPTSNELPSARKDELKFFDRSPRKRKFMQLPISRIPSDISESGLDCFLLKKESKENAKVSCSLEEENRRLQQQLERMKDRQILARQLIDKFRDYSNLTYRVYLQGRVALQKALASQREMQRELMTCLPKQKEVNIREKKASPSTTNGEEGKRKSHDVTKDRKNVETSEVMSICIPKDQEVELKINRGNDTTMEQFTRAMTDMMSFAHAQMREMDSDCKGYNDLAKSEDFDGSTSVTSSTPDVEVVPKQNLKGTVLSSEDASIPIQGEQIKRDCVDADLCDSKSRTINQGEHCNDYSQSLLDINDKEMKADKRKFWKLCLPFGRNPRQKNGHATKQLTPQRRASAIKILGNQMPVPVQRSVTLCNKSIQCSQFVKEKCSNLTNAIIQEECTFTNVIEIIYDELSFAQIKMISLPSINVSHYHVNTLYCQVHQIVFERNSLKIDLERQLQREQELTEVGKESKKKIVRLEKKCQFLKLKIRNLQRTICIMQEEKKEAQTASLSRPNHAKIKKMEAAFYSNHGQFSWICDICQSSSKNGEKSRRSKQRSSNPACREKATEREKTSNNQNEQLWIATGLLNDYKELQRKIKVYESDMHERDLAYTALTVEYNLTKARLQAMENQNNSLSAIMYEKIVKCYFENAQQENNCVTNQSSDEMPLHGKDTYQANVDKKRKLEEKAILELNTNIEIAKLRKALKRVKVKKRALEEVVSQLREEILHLSTESKDQNAIHSSSLIKCDQHKIGEGKQHKKEEQEQDPRCKETTTDMKELEKIHDAKFYTLTYQGEGKKQLDETHQQEPGEIQRIQVQEVVDQRKELYRKDQIIKEKCILIEKLERELESLVAERNVSSIDTGSEKENIKSNMLAEELQSCKEQLMKLSDENTLLCKENKNLKREKMSIENKLSKANEEEIRLIEENKSLQKENSNVKCQLDKVKWTRESAEETNNLLQDEVEEMKTKLCTSEGHRLKTEEENSLLKEELINIKKDFDQMKEHNQSLTEELKQSESKVADLEENVDRLTKSDPTEELKKDIEHLEAISHELRVENDDLIKELQTKEECSVESQRKIEELEDSLNELKIHTCETVAGQERNVTDLNETIKNMRDIMTAKDEKIALLQGDLERAQSDASFSCGLGNSPKNTNHGNTTWNVKRALSPVNENDATEHPTFVDTSARDVRKGEKLDTTVDTSQLYVPTWLRSPTKEQEKKTDRRNSCLGNYGDAETVNKVLDDNAGLGYSEDERKISGCVRNTRSKSLSIEHGKVADILGERSERDKPPVMKLKTAWRSVDEEDTQRCSLSSTSPTKDQYTCAAFKNSDLFATKLEAEATRSRRRRTSIFDDSGDSVQEDQVKKMEAVPSKYTQNTQHLQSRGKESATENLLSRRPIGSDKATSVEAKDDSLDEFEDELDKFTRFEARLKTNKQTKQPSQKQTVQGDELKILSSFCESITPQDQMQRKKEEIPSMNSGCKKNESGARYGRRMSAPC